MNPNKDPKKSYTRTQKALATAAMTMVGLAGATAKLAVEQPPAKDGPIYLPYSLDPTIAGIEVPAGEQAPLGETSGPTGTTIAGQELQGEQILPPSMQGSPPATH